MRGEVADASARFLLALDDHRWGQVEVALDETLSRDYTSLFGGKPDAIAASGLVAEWREVLTGLDSHQHLTGPAVVELIGGEASANVHVVAMHVLEGHPGSPGSSAVPIDSPYLVGRGAGASPRSSSTRAGRRATPPSSSARPTPSRCSTGTDDVLTSAGALARK
jgi:hypothetical protein